MQRLATADHWSLESGIQIASTLSKEHHVGRSCFIFRSPPICSRLSLGHFALRKGYYQNQGNVCLFRQVKTALFKEQSAHAHVLRVDVGVMETDNDRRYAVLVDRILAPKSCGRFAVYFKTNPLVCKECYFLRVLPRMTPLFCKNHLTTSKPRRSTEQRQDKF